MNELDNPAAYSELSENEKYLLQTWISKNLVLIKTINDTADSYFLKNLYQRKTGHYVTNGQFKGAMLAAGFRAKDETAHNWHFNVSKRSPAFKQDH